MYVKVTNGTPTNYTIGQLRRDNPSTSFPRKVPDAILAEYDVFKVSNTEAPNYDSRTQTVSQNETATQVNGVWTYEWTVSSKTAEQIQEYDDAEAVSVRRQRDSLLAETDWVVIKAKETGGNLSTAFKEYRQALRDITAQDGFPYDITWPEKP